MWSVTYGLVFTIFIDEFAMIAKPKTKPKAEVTFHPDTVVERKGPSSPAVKFGGGVDRCISIPNADLKDVDYQEEKDVICK